MTISDGNRLRHKQDRIIKYAMKRYGKDFGHMHLSEDYPNSPTMSAMLYILRGNSPWIGSLVLWRLNNEYVDFNNDNFPIS